MTWQDGNRQKSARGLIDQSILWAETATFLRVTIVVMWVGRAAYSVVHYLYLPAYPLRIVVSWVLGLAGVIELIQKPDSVDELCNVVARLAATTNNTIAGWDHEVSGPNPVVDVVPAANCNACQKVRGFPSSMSMPSM